MYIPPHRRIVASPPPPKLRNTLHRYCVDISDFFDVTPRDKKPLYDLLYHPVHLLFLPRVKHGHRRRIYYQKRLLNFHHRFFFLYVCVMGGHLQRRLQNH